MKNNNEFENPLGAIMVAIKGDSLNFYSILPENQNLLKNLFCGNEFRIDLSYRTHLVKLNKLQFNVEKGVYDIMKIQNNNQCEYVFAEMLYFILFSRNSTNKLHCKIS